ncbi:MAG: hypothetical protein JJ973_00810 [Rhodospirillales bacterium]|nr:hypothetical protein [Rhodospirillales bacterium]
MRENDRQKFVNLAEKRTNNAIKQIRLIGNLSNKSNYDYEKKHVDAIFKRLNFEINEAKKRFDQANGGGGSDLFKLDF